MIDVKKMAGYLHYKLLFEGGGDIWSLYSIGVDGDVVLKNGLHMQEIVADSVGVEYKPFLVPVQELSIVEMMDFYSSFIDFPIKWDLRSIQNLHLRANWFFERHYDVYGLIEQGLAVVKPEPL